PGVRVLHDFGPVEGRTEHRGVRVLAAQPATDAAVDHGRDRVAAQRIGVVLHGERRAAGQPDARVVAGAGVLVDAIFHFHHSLARRELLRIDRPELALALELAFAFGNDDLEALVIGGHRFLQRLRDFADAVIVDGADPVDADAGEGALHAHVRRVGLAVLRRGGQLLRTRGGAVAVLHDHQDAVVLVEHRVGDAGGEAVVPEAAVAHHRHSALGE